MPSPIDCTTSLQPLDCQATQVASNTNTLRSGMGYKSTIPSRHKDASRAKTKRPKWQPTGPFRFFDLPPELRSDILEHVLSDDDFAPRDTLHLLLTCARMYRETASIFYHDVVLDTTQGSGKCDPFLVGPLTRIRPHQYVKRLTIAFYLWDQIHLFQSSYAAALQKMAKEGNLQSLRLDIESRFPSAAFWGGDDDEDDRRVVDQSWVTAKQKNGVVQTVPQYMIQQPFQSFLQFLDKSSVAKITLHVDARDHARLWCDFHRKHASGKECNGHWKGKSRQLKVDWKKIVKELGGLEHVTQHARKRANKPSFNTPGGLDYSHASH